MQRRPISPAPDNAREHNLSSFPDSLSIHQSLSFAVGFGPLDLARKESTLLARIVLKILQYALVIAPLLTLTIEINAPSNDTAVATHIRIAAAFTLLSITTYHIAWLWCFYRRAFPTLASVFSAQENNRCMREYRYKVFMFRLSQFGLKLSPMHPYWGTLRTALANDDVSPYVKRSPFHLACQYSFLFAALAIATTVPLDELNASIAVLCLAMFGTLHELFAIAAPTKRTTLDTIRYIVSEYAREHRDSPAAGSEADLFPISTVQ